jgi:hypothetical protein
MGFYTKAQSSLPGFGTPAVVPRLEFHVKLVGIIVFNNAVVQDDVDRAYGFVVLTPALIREVIAASPTAPGSVAYGLQLKHGSLEVRTVEQEIFGLLPRHAAVEFHVTSRIVTQVELAIKPESAALDGFGAIAALVCLVLGIQAISRQLRWADEERRVLRALGASPVVTAVDGIIGIFGAVALGSLVAVGVAVGLSPLAPLGPVRPFYPDKGIGFDWTVLGVGLAVLVAVLGSSALALCVRGAPYRVERSQGESRGSRRARTAESTGVPVACVVGVHFALEPGTNRSAVPVRSAMVGTVVAIIVVVGAFTFASSLRTLVSRPPLSRWNWSYALDPTNDVPPQALKVLGHDFDVAGWGGCDYNIVEIDGQTVPVLFARSLSEVVSPPILSGHGLDADNQIVIGAAS